MNIDDRTKMHEFLGFELRSPRTMLARVPEFVAWFFTCCEYAIIVGGVSAAAKIGSMPATATLAFILQLLLMMFIGISVYRSVLETAAVWPGPRWLIRLTFEVGTVLLIGVFIALPMAISTAITTVASAVK